MVAVATGAGAQLQKFGITDLGSCRDERSPALARKFLGNLFRHILFAKRPPRLMPLTSAGQRAVLPAGTCVVFLSDLTNTISYRYQHAELHHVERHMPKVQFTCEAWWPC